MNAHAGIRIMGNCLDLESITSHLGIEPTHRHKEGEPAKCQENYCQDMWSLQAPLDKKKKLDSHLRWLVKFLSSHYDYLQALKPDAQIDVFCSYTFEGDQGGFSLSPKALSIFTALGIKLEVSLIALKVR